MDGVESGLEEISYAKCEDVKSISERRLLGRLGVVEYAALFEIARALRFLLELCQRLDRLCHLPTASA